MGPLDPTIFKRYAWCNRWSTPSQRRKHTVAAGGEYPLIDFDFTALIQLAIFAIMGLVSSRLLFRPYLRMREERSAGIEGARAEADRMSAEADARMADYEGKLASARRRADEERRRLRADAATHQREVTDKARAEALETMEKAQGRVREEADAARGELMPRADRLGGEIASRLLGRKVA